MIRPTTPEDTDALVAIADSTGVFKPIELVALREVLDDYFAAREGQRPRLRHPGASTASRRRSRTTPRPR